MKMSELTISSSVRHSCSNVTRPQFLTGLIILMLCFSGAAAAAGGPKATVDQLNAEAAARADADSTLQNNIDNISLTPGPQGPAGENGADGEDGIDGMDGADAPDRTDDLCALYQVLSIQSLIGSLPVPDYCQLGALLAVAYINDDGIDGYSGTADTLIAGLFDANNDSVVSVGDQIRYGSYPMDFEAAQRGIYLESVITVAEVFDQFSTVIRLRDTTGGDHEWETDADKDSYVCEAGSSDMFVRWIDGIGGPIITNDVITVESELGFCGTPRDVLGSSIVTLDNTDNHFIDVDIFIQ